MLFGDPVDRGGDPQLHHHEGTAALKAEQAPVATGMRSAKLSPGSLRLPFPYLLLRQGDLGGRHFARNDVTMASSLH